jgi:hypothetical protein
MCKPLPLSTSSWAATTPREPTGHVPQACVPVAVASRLAAGCDTAMTEHRWSAHNVRAAREVLSIPLARGLVKWLADRLSRQPGSGPGWAVLALPSEMGDENMQRAAAGLLAGVGWPFFSIPSASWLWIGQESSADRDSASFGGVGSQRLHIDALNVERVPDYSCLLMLRPDPAGGGASLIGDLQAAMATMSVDDRVQLARPVFFEGRAQGLCGVGDPRIPFPVLDTACQRQPWIRWAGKMLDDPRNDSDLSPVLRRFTDALAAHTHEVLLERGHLLIVDQQRIAHGRTALGEQTGLPDGFRRLLLQAKTAGDQAAPAQTRLAGRPR